MNEVFVITNGHQFLDWDDHSGPMSTGYPMWVELQHARQYLTLHTATKSAEAVKRCDKISVWIQRVSLVLGEKAPVMLPEEDPEYAEYQRLKKKFQ